MLEARIGKGGIKYLLRNDIPEEHKTAFFKWMHGQTGLYTEDGDAAYFYCDYEHWYNLVYNNVPTYWD